MKAAFAVVALVGTVLAGVVAYLLLRERDEEPTPPAGAAITIGYTPPAKRRTGGGEPATREPATPTPTREVIPTKPPEVGTPENPQPGDKLYPGFTGFFQVVEGRYLTHYAKDLGIGGSNWPMIRDHPENAWIKALTPKAKWGTYGLDLVPRYGKFPPVDCVAPGYKAQKKTAYTGQHAVLYWKPVI